MCAIFVLLLALISQAPATVRPVEQPYKKIEISEPDVQEAVKVAQVRQIRRTPPDGVC